MPASLDCSVFDIAYFCDVKIISWIQEKKNEVLKIYIWNKINHLISFLYHIKLMNPKLMWNFFFFFLGAGGLYNRFPVS